MTGWVATVAIVAVILGLYLATMQAAKRGESK